VGQCLYNCWNEASVFGFVFVQNPEKKRRMISNSKLMNISDINAIDVRTEVCELRTWRLGK
jgi:hypothetical protein